MECQGFGEFAGLAEHQGEPFLCRQATQESRLERQFPLRCQSRAHANVPVGSLYPSSRNAAGVTIWVAPMDRSGSRCSLSPVTR